MCSSDLLEQVGVLAGSEQRNLDLTEKAATLESQTERIHKRLQVWYTLLNNS